jgi:hypothetical protein
MQSMDLTGLTIYDIYGVDQVELKGDFTAATLSEKLIEEWIPYFECHQCGRFDYCKYVEPNPTNPNRSADIQCGVASDCIKNLINSIFSDLEKMDRNQTQSFLNGAFFFYQFVYDTEQYIGMNMNYGFHKYFGEYAPNIYSRVSFLRGHLSDMVFHWKDLPNFSAKSPVLFVEGYSEKAFLDEMRRSHLSWFLDLTIEVYAGEGNRRSKRINMLLNKYKEQGLVVYLQGDADGEHQDIFRGLVNSGCINHDNTFVFMHDFETAIPSNILFNALVEMQFLTNISIDEFNQKLGTFNVSVIQRLNDVFGINIGSDKIELATTVASLLNTQDTWPSDQTFMNETELGQFLKFIQRVI